MNWKLFLLASTAAVIALGCNGTSNKQPRKDNNPGLPEMNKPANSFHSDFNNEPHYTSEEVEMNRLVSVDRDGSETITTDETVIQILELAQHAYPAQIFTEPQPQEVLKGNEGGQGREKRKVICNDNRTLSTTESFPSCAIGYLASGCSAFLVGPFHALTAGHCVYSNGAFERDLDVYIGRGCWRHGNRMPWVKAWTLQGWKINGSREYDLGLILLSFAYPSKCWLPLGYFDPMPSVALPSSICGYPSDIRGIFSCYVCTNCNDVRLARISQLVITQNMYEYTCDTVRGQSGSPVMTNTTQGLYAIGVHTAESDIYCANYGTRISKQLYVNICHWMCQNQLRCRAVC